MLADELCQNRSDYGAAYARAGKRDAQREAPVFPEAVYEDNRHRHRGGTAGEYTDEHGAYIHVIYVLREGIAGIGEPHANYAQDKYPAGIC